MEIGIDKKFTYWLFADMLFSDKENIYEFVEFKKVTTKTNKEVPCLILLGQAQGKKGKDDILTGDFVLSRWSAKLDKVIEKLGTNTDNWGTPWLKATKKGNMIEFEVV